MSGFSESNWAKREFTKGYRDNADIFIVDRRRMLTIVQSFYSHFIKKGKRRAMLDLGCGDGIVTAAVAEVDGSVAATLVDASSDMLARARERLNGMQTAPRFIRSTFQEIIRRGRLEGGFDLIASSLAIHHLAMDEKTLLFKKIYRLLNRGGHFVNIDVVLAPSETLEQWYLSLWRDWIDENKWNLSLSGRGFDGIIERYKNAEENKPDTLKVQLEALENIGFGDVDCYYRNGIFTMFGGRRQP